jgi:hypothetical protein
MAPARTAATRKTAIAVGIAIVIALASFAFRSHFQSSPAPGVLRLSDGIEVLYTGGSTVAAMPGYPTPHELRIDGDVLVRQPASEVPLVIRTSLLILTASGPSEFRVTAVAKSCGAQVEVLSGTVEARKAYPSPYPAPDLLGAGEMSMVNQTIDLMEKEKTDVVALRAWRDALIASISEQSVASVSDSPSRAP